MVHGVEETPELLRLASAPENVPAIVFRGRPHLSEATILFLLHCSSVRASFAHPGAGLRSASGTTPNTASGIERHDLRGRHEGRHTRTRGRSAHDGRGYRGDHRPLPPGLLPSEGVPTARLPIWAPDPRFGMAGASPAGDSAHRKGPRTIAMENLRTCARHRD